MNKKALKTLEYDKILAQLSTHASTPRGKKLCADLLPMNQLAEIRESLSNTTDAENRIFRQGNVSFSGVRDYIASLKRLEVGSALAINELLAISSTLDVSARVKSYGRKSEGLESDSLTTFFSRIEPLTPLNESIKKCIISEEEISDDASPALKNIRRQMRLTNERIHSQLNSLLVTARDYLQDSVITMRDGRYCLPVRAEYKSNVPGVVHDQSGSGKAFFIEPISIVNLNNEHRELEIKEQKEIEIILAKLSNEASEFTGELETDYFVLTNLDFIFAKANFGISYRGSEPVFNDERKINIKKGRHPLLAKESVVPINVWLGDEFDLLIITGPNTGGKTVTLKTIGLLTLMGESGLLIPANDKSELAIFDDVFADIGDEQSIEQSLSTFSSHMTNIVEILKQANENSLVLFDELGAGTDPIEGAALATAILSHLHDRGIRTVATTHYSELKMFALNTPGVENASCEFDVATLKPTYKLLVGIPGKSNAFAISKRLGLSDEMIEKAKAQIGSNDEAFEDVISDLETRRKNIESQEEEAIKLRNEIAKLKKEVAEKHSRIDERREKIIREAEEEAKRILSEAKATADKAISAMNKAGISVGKEAEAERSLLREKINEANDRLASKNKRSKKAPIEKLHIGDEIKVLSLGVNGTVSTLPDAKGNLFVQMGIIRSSVNVSDIELLEEKTDNKKVSKTSGIGNIKSDKSANVSAEINLVGMYADEASAELEKYLDDAYLAGLTSVRIIHGRGTGALKSMVADMLRKNKHVKSSRGGEYDEGGYGVTVALFK